MATQRWIPLESNPSVLNKYMTNLGVDEKWKLVELYGLEPDLLMMVPRPVAAVMLLYPLNDKVKDIEIGTVEKESIDNLYFMHQSIRNACGTVALVHALASNEDKIPFDSDKPFSKFLKETSALSPEEKGAHLETDEAMSSAHEESANEGDTQAPSRDTTVKPHFITLVECKGKLYEMDGRKAGPVDHGETSPDTLLEDAVKVVKKFMARDPDELSFSVMALAKEE